jgi:hypothetical protein
MDAGKWARASWSTDQRTGKKARRVAKERRHVLRDLGAVPIASRLTVTTERRRRADLMFPSLGCQGYKPLGSYMVLDQIAYLILNRCIIC